MRKFLTVAVLTIGLLAEMQARTYHESQGKPIYIIKEIVESHQPAHATGKRT